VGSNPTGTILLASWRNWIAHQTSNLGVAGSSPAGVVAFWRDRVPGPGSVVWDRVPGKEARDRVPGKGAIARQRGISSIGRVRRSQRRGTGIETRILQSFGTQGPQWRNWIAHQTSNLGVVGSNPTWGAHAFGSSSEAMAQWQRVGFQTQRLGVRIPLASCFPNGCG
jgi:hypothetical protein